MSAYEGKVVLVTGGGCGAGRAAALAFASQGAKLAVNDLTPINLDKTIEAIRNAGGECGEYIFDVGKKMPVQAMIERIREDWGSLDIVVNHAQVRPKDSILDMDEWDWRRVVEVNLSGVFFVLQSAGRVLRDQGGGAILNLISLPNEQDSAAVHASAAGLIELTRRAACEFAPYHVRVNSVTSSGGASVHRQSAELALFLCNPEADHPTGQVLHARGWGTESSEEEHG